MKIGTCTNISLLKEKGSKYIIWMLLGLLLLVITFPTGNTKKQVKKLNSTDLQQDDIEIQLKHILMNMEGVGEVEVMVATKDEQGELFSISEAKEDVCGVVVVAEGAGNARVDARISDAIKALFGIDAHKISIVKMQSREVVK